MGVPLTRFAQGEICRACVTRDCCHEREVEARADEVVTIARALAIAPERFCRLNPSDDGPIALAAPIEGVDRYRAVLEKRSDGAGRRACVFLTTAGSGRKVCGLGALAPSACAAFPAPHLGPDGGRVEGCWRTWDAGEVSVPRARRGAHDEALERWHARLAERRSPVPARTFALALLADEDLGVAASMSEAGAEPLPEPDSRSGCATCTTARCCVVFDPAVTGADLVRLIDGLGLVASDIAALGPVRADQAGADAVHFGDARAWELRLRRTGARAPEEPRRCGFLVDLSAEGLPAANRCGVYAQRPLACRLFPSDLTELGVMVMTPEAICPPQAWSQERADLPALHALHFIAGAERQRYRTFVGCWNEAAAALAEADHETREARFLEALIAFERAATGRPPHEHADLAREVIRT